MSRLVLEALGTLWYIRVYDDEFPYELQAEVTSVILSFQRDYSRFVRDSLLNRLNRTGRFSNPPQALFEMCRQGEELRKLSGGAFNLSVCYVLVKEGYGNDFRERVANMSNSELRVPFVQLEPESIRLRDGVSIDLGAIGKGYLVDTVAKLLKSNGIQYFVINAGGDIYATTNHNERITCVLENPFNSREFIGTISLSNRGIACSSQNKRYWTSVVSGKRVAHLIDTKTFRPKRGVAAVFTESETTATADAVSTALFVSDPDKYKAIAESTDTEFAIIYEDGRCYRSSGYHGNFSR
ncbi:MAG: Thiamine biosynthesis lipoprotein ApbE precursor [candidate division WS6 bacterium OLB20]|uniref:FAD:protein FMN transferase n=1 Tax=candidate division WS6 bacterium OLB20 TaxID=1617426 RepID=A0A136LXP5_9BACT|nr:MAG: Thiamine biosynthesis lipoprotein ApbE precursor [candidate division WS6 bacterium OLB20]